MHETAGGIPERHQGTAANFAVLVVVKPPALATVGSRVTPDTWVWAQRLNYYQRAPVQDVYLPVLTGFDQQVRVPCDAECCWEQRGPARAEVQVYGIQLDVIARGECILGDQGLVQLHDRIAQLPVLQRTGERVGAVAGRDVDGIAVAGQAATTLPDAATT